MGAEMVPGVSPPAATVSPPAARPPRVLHVFQPPVAGVPHYVRSIAEGLAARGWSQSVFCAPDVVVIDDLLELGVSVRTADLVRRPDPRTDLAAVRALVAQIRDEGVGVVHAHSSKAGVLGGAAARLAGVPSVYTPHGWSFQMDGGAAARTAYAAVERILARAVHAHVVTVSAAEVAAARRRRVVAPGRTSVVHTGLKDAPPGPGRRESRRRLGLDPDGFVAAWVGRNDPQKRPQDLAGLAARLGSAGTVLALGQKLAGSPEAAAFEGAGGHLVPEDTPTDVLMAAADVLVQTSAWEGFPLVVLEGLRAGLPVLAYPVGGVGEQVLEGVCGYLFPVGAVDALAGRMLALAADPEELRRLSHGATVRSGVFGYDAMIDGLATVYRAVQPIVETRPGTAKHERILM